MLFRHLLLKLLDFLATEFNHFIRFDIDEVVTVFRAASLVARPAVGEAVTLDQTMFREQVHRPVNRCDVDTRLDRSDTSVEFLRIGMIVRLGAVRRIPFSLQSSASLLPGLWSYARYFLCSLSRSACSAASLRSRGCATRFFCICHYTIYGLLSVTGLRVSEALNLDVDDVDLVSGVITSLGGGVNISRHSVGLSKARRT